MKKKKNKEKETQIPEGGEDVYIAKSFMETEKFILSQGRNNYWSM